MAISIALVTLTLLSATMDNDNDAKEDDRKPSREEKEALELQVEMDESQSEFSLLDVVAERSAAATKACSQTKLDVGEDTDEDDKVEELLHRLQVEEVREELKKDLAKTTEKTVLASKYSPGMTQTCVCIPAHEAATRQESGLVFLRGACVGALPGAYAAEPGLELVRQETGALSASSTRSFAFSFDSDEEESTNDIENPPPTPEEETLQLNLERLEVHTPCRPAPVDETLRLSESSYLASAHLVQDHSESRIEMTTHEAQPLTHMDLLIAFYKSSMGTCLSLVALLFGIGLVVTLLLAMFLWYEPAFLLATALAVMMLLVVVIIQVSTISIRPSGEKHHQDHYYLYQRRWKVLLVLLLLTLAALVCYGVYWSSRNYEVDVFESQFQDLTSRLVDGFHDNVRLRLQVMDMLSVSVTSYVLATNQSWPFVVIPHFDAQ